MGVDDGDTELNRFECPGPSAPVTSAGLMMYVSWGKIMYKDLIFVRRNVDGSHTDDGILEVLKLERHAVQTVGLIAVACCSHLQKILFVVIFESSNCFKPLPHKCA